MKAVFPIISKSWLRLTIAAVVVAASLWLFFSNARYSIQFTGGVEVVVDAESISTEAVQGIQNSLEEAGYTDSLVHVGKRDSYPSLLVQLAFEADTQVNELTTLLQTALQEEQVIATEEDIVELSIIGPSIGSYIKKSAQTALIVGSILMAIYILFAFSAMRWLVSPAALALITIVTMIFDIAMPAGAYGLRMMLNPTVQIDTVFIVGLLTIMGYSVNDTIIIFDRVRENFLHEQEKLEKGHTTNAEIFEMSLRQTMKRSLGTSFSTFIVIVAMYLFGTGVLKSFSFVLGIGVIAGSYSSIFVAAPLAYLFSAKKKI